MSTRCLLEGNSQCREVDSGETRTKNWEVNMFMDTSKERLIECQINQHRHDYTVEI